MLRAKTRVSALRGGETGSKLSVETWGVAGAVIRTLLSGRVWENRRRHKEEKRRAQILMSRVMFSKERSVTCKKNISQFLTKSLCRLFDTALNGCARDASIASLLRRQPPCRPSARSFAGTGPSARHA